MASTSTVRRWWASHRCEVGERIALFGRNVYLQKEAHDAGRALEQALYDYGPVEVLGSHRWCPTGISGKTCQSSGLNCSLHNYSIAFDFDPFKYGNPHIYRKFTSDADYKLTKFTKAQVARVHKIRTNNGKQVWRWLGDLIGDTMHWEITCSPADLATGINWATVPGEQPSNPIEEDDIMLKKGDKGNAVAKFQRALLGHNKDSLPRYGADGDFGAETEAAVKAYQKSAEIAQTGMIDGVTASLLLEYVADAVGGSGADATARKAAAAAQAKADKAYNLADAQKQRLDNV